MTTRAVAYTSDIILGRTGEVIKRAEQQLAIRRHAKENNIEIIAWFEDEIYAETPSERPGLRALLDCADNYDVVLLERIWALSRSWKKVKSILDALESRGKRLETSTWLWDCVSVLSRHHGCRASSCAAETRAEEPACAVNAEPEVRSSKPAPRISRPVRLNFMNLLNQGKPA